MKIKFSCIFIILLLLCSCRTESVVSNVSSDDDLDHSSETANASSSEREDSMSLGPWRVFEGTIYFDSMEDFFSKVNDGSVVECFEDVSVSFATEQEINHYRNACLENVVYEMYLDGEKLSTNNDFIGVALEFLDMGNYFQYVVEKQFNDGSRLCFLVRICDYYPEHSYLNTSIEDNWKYYKKRYSGIGYEHKLISAVIDGKETECLVPSRWCGETGREKNRCLGGPTAFAIFYDSKVIIEFGVIYELKWQYPHELRKSSNEKFGNAEVLDVPTVEALDLENFLHRISFKKVELDLDSTAPEQ